MKRLTSVVLALAMLLSMSNAFAVPLSAEGIVEPSASVTTAPQEASVPADTMSAPEVTTVPEETSLPEIVTTPEETTVPEVTTVPEDTIVPEETTIPEETTAPEETTPSSEETSEDGSEGTETEDSEPIVTDTVPEVTDPLPEATEPELIEELLPEDLLLAAAGNIVDSGYCGGEGNGTNLTWTLDSEGTLTISGNGKMRDYNTYVIKHTEECNNCGLLHFRMVCV